MTIIRQGNRYSLEILKDKKRERFEISEATGKAMIDRLELKVDRVTSDLEYWES